MRFNLVVKLKYQASTIIQSVGITYFGVTHFVTPVTMSDQQSSDVRHMR